MTKRQRAGAGVATGLVRRFVREARATAKLQHPNIVTVHFVGETPEGLPFLVMACLGRCLVA